MFLLVSKTNVLIHSLAWERELNGSSVICSGLMRGEGLYELCGREYFDRGLVVLIYIFCI